MKQTPIPEKINLKIKDPNDLLQTVIGMIVSTLNPIIDVLTEQQKENDNKRGQIEHLERRVYELLKRVDAIEKYIRESNYCTCIGERIDKQGYCGNCGKKPESYTAMRSTGKTATEVVEAIKRHNGLEYCVCEKSMVNTNIEGESTCVKCLKPIKPQEDKMSQIIRILFFSKGWDGTKAEAYDIADRILAIVKGE